MLSRSSTTASVHGQLFRKTYVQDLVHVVFIDGACLANGTPHARGGYGVYFAANSRYNTQGPLPRNERQTSQRAELLSCFVALEQIEKFYLEHQRQVQTAVIVTDSSYIVESLTKYIYNWRENGYMSVSGDPVRNRDLFEQIDEKLEDMNEMHNIEVLFWKIDRSENENANRLAAMGAQMDS